MPLRYLLDTNTCSYIIKGYPPTARKHLRQVPVSEVGISVVIEAELRFGVAGLPHANRLNVAIEEFLLRLEILPWDSAAAREYARIRAELEKHGESMGNLDVMIAAQALAAEVVLVTSDRVFRRVKGLRTEDWAR